MAFQDLSKMGMRPAGSGAGGFLEGMIKGVEGFLPAYNKATEKKAKREKDRIDRYITMRKAGYTPEQIEDYSRTGKFSVPEGEDLENKKTNAEIDLLQSKSEYYKSGGSKGTFTTKRKIDEINEKIYNGEVLDQIDIDFMTAQGEEVPTKNMPKVKSDEEGETNVKVNTGNKDIWDFGKPGRSKPMLFLDRILGANQKTNKKADNMDSKMERASKLISEKLYKGKKKPTKAQIELFLKNNPSF